MTRSCATALLLVAALPFACGDEESGARDKQTAPATTSDGHRVVGASRAGETPTAKTKGGPVLPDTERWIEEPTSEDPHAGSFSLTEAVEGLPVDGKLVAEVRTDLGFFFCDLFADRKPQTVAHFVGLARGTRAWWDPSAGAWRSQPLYRNAEFFRVIPDEMIVAGGVGGGLADIALKLPFEKLEQPLSHDRKGQLMLIDGGGKFAISDGPNRGLDAKRTHSIFGQCYPEDLAFRVARVPQWGSDHGNRPRTKVAIHRIVIRRSEKGAQNERPELPGGHKALPKHREASRGPSEIHGRHKQLRQGTEHTH